ncbi:MAG: hypothetical protein HC915_12895 [Anaerolineae bacterium]|nr:hypothetical protein [Anaerolineae bacterium]
MIAHFQKVLTQIDGQTVPYSDAVAAWYDMIYETTVLICQEQGLMELFPQRTQADLFVFIMRYREQLEVRHSNDVRLTQAIRAVEDEQKSPLKKALRGLGRRKNGPEAGPD